MGRWDLNWKKAVASDDLFCKDDIKAASYNKQKTAEQPATAKDVLPEPASERSGVLGWAIRNPMLILSWLLSIFVGLPLRFQGQHDAFLSTALLFAVWFTTLAVQASFKTNPPSHRPWLSTALFGLSNAVLWTSLIMIAYVFAETATTHRSLHTMLDTLQTNVTITSLVFPPGDAAPTPAPTHLAAGDIALCILNAGLVSWGLKLYEYRRQLVSRAGLTVLLVSSVLAAGNVALGPLLARALGLRSAPTALAFAARSVTLALGSPVMAALRADVGLNAAMVVMSGIVFQVGLGFGVGGWLERNLVERCPPVRQAAAAAPPSDVTVTARSSVTLQGTDDDDEGLDLEAQVLAEHPHASVAKVDSTPRTVASGVTIGINAAAMGTAYLYEVKSEAAPYSALSMMAMGIMTVVFASIPPLQAWVVGAVA
jgi:putative effector of murein hydrolase